MESKITGVGNMKAHWIEQNKKNKIGYVPACERSSSYHQDFPFILACRHMASWNQAWPCDLLWTIKCKQKWKVSLLARSTKDKILCAFLSCWATQKDPGGTVTRYQKFCQPGSLRMCSSNIWFLSSTSLIHFSIYPEPKGRQQMVWDGNHGVSFGYVNMWYRRHPKKILRR